MKAKNLIPCCFMRGEWRAVVVALIFSVAGARAAEKPNVLFIAVDDLRPQLNCYGEGYMHTPNIGSAI